MTDPVDSIRMNDYTEAARLSSETSKPVYVKDGDIESVVISARAFDDLREKLAQLELEAKLRQGFAEIDAGKSQSFDDFWAEFDKELRDAGNCACAAFAQQLKKINYLNGGSHAIT